MKCEGLSEIDTTQPLGRGFTVGGGGGGGHFADSECFDQLNFKICVYFL